MTPTSLAQDIGSEIRAARKFVAALAGVAAIVLADGLVSGAAAHWLTAGLAALTAAGVYVVPNKPTTGAEPPRP